MGEGIIPITIPCLDMGGVAIGSCEYEGDALLTEAMCAVFPEHQPCSFPLGPGVYGTGEPVTSVVGEIPHHREPAGHDARRHLHRGQARPPLGLPQDQDEGRLSPRTLPIQILSHYCIV